jgi:hypothetical protein
MLFVTVDALAQNSDKLLETFRVDRRQGNQLQCIRIANVQPPDALGCDDAPQEVQTHEGHEEQSQGGRPSEHRQNRHVVCKVTGYVQSDGRDQQDRLRLQSSPEFY